MSWFPLNGIAANGELKIYWRINSEVFANYIGQVFSIAFYKKMIAVQVQTAFLLRRRSSISPKPIKNHNRWERPLGGTENQTDDPWRRRNDDFDRNPLRGLFRWTSSCCSLFSTWLLNKQILALWFLFVFYFSQAWCSCKFAILKGRLSELKVLLGGVIV